MFLENLIEVFYEIKQVNLYVMLNKEKCLVIDCINNIVIFWKIGFIDMIKNKQK